MKHIVIALFEQAAEAQRAADALTSQGFDQISVHASEAFDTEALPAAAEIEGGPASGLLERLAALFGVHEPRVAHYHDAVRKGGSVVEVATTSDAGAAKARDALHSLGALRIDEQVQE